MTAWLLIITGLIFIGIALYLKYPIYEVKKVKSKERKKLEEIGSELEGIINDISLKEKQIKNKIKEMDIEHRDYGQRQRVNDVNKFREVLDRHYEKIEHNDQLPDRYEQVFALYKQGKSPEIIARKMDLGIRETKLILKLHQRKAGNDV